MDYKKTKFCCNFFNRSRIYVTLRSRERSHLAKSSHVSYPIPIYEDNQSCISIATNSTNHKRTKHIDIKYHFIRDQIEKQVLILYHLPTDQQLADAFTKPITPIKFLQIRAKLALLEMFAILVYRGILNFLYVY